MSNIAEAGDDATPRPPEQYRLADVSITIRHQTSRGIPGGYQIALHGDGTAYLQNTDANPVKTELHNSTAAIIELLNDFYRIHFFDLADTYAKKKQVLLRDDGLVATTVMKMADVDSKKLCVQLADYQKCVTIINNEPAEASQLIAKIEKLFRH
ncbi:MAG: hypothetical protein M0R33_06585 [Methylomonas sp.]|uniref:hypothetical protein n=1 Tax=Methylomonas sp. TaxID=418 RepID=UPI0025F618DA|nr:hypothetical protein [Methylomonas sp.]MCK9606104.1 hypothetical protein [Methylomonas sp.]